MKLNKLIRELADAIVDAGFDTNPKEIESISLPKIKSGADLFVLAPEGTGKTTTIVLSIIQQLKKEFEEAPRAIVIVENRDKAFQLEEQFKLLGGKTSLRIFTVFDKGDIQYQKDMIYEGLDILIGTPNRINELLSVTGIPTSALKILAVDDAERIYMNNQHPVIYRIADRTNKLQYLVLANKWHEKFDDMWERLEKSPMIVKR